LYSLSLLGTVLLAAMISQILMRLGYLRTAGWMFLIVFWTIITLTTFLTGGIVAPSHVVYLTIIVMASLILGKWGGLIFTLLSGAAGFVFLLLQLNGDLPEPLIPYDLVSQWVVYVINMLMLAFSVWLSVQKLYQSLERVVAELKERKRVEEARLEAESRYRALVEQVPAIVYTAEFGQSGHWHYVSPQIDEVLGFSVEEWEQDPELWYKQLYPEDKERVIGEEARSRETGEAFRSEYRLIDRNGNETWFLDEARVIRDSNGRSLFLQGVMYNITERKGVEEKLAQSESKYRQLANLLPQIVFETDLSGRITLANQTAFDAFGYDQGDFERGLNALHMIVPGDRQRAADNMQRIAQAEKPVDPEYTAIAKDGHTFPILIFSAPVYEEHQIVGTRGVIVDISDRKRAEDELKNSEERFRSAFDNAPIGMALIGLDDQILQVNQALCDMLGYTREQLVNKTLAGISYPGDPDLELGSQAGLLNGGNESFTIERRYVHADGKIVWGQLSVSLVVNKDNAPLYYLGQLQDISGRKEAEETLRASEQKYQLLYSDAKRQARELMLLHRVRTAIAGELELDAVIRAVVEAVAETFGYTLVSLYLRESDQLHLHSQVGYDETVIRWIKAFAAGSPVPEKRN
jgi:PAS domain S-box-containing protein